ncbi:secretin N-terminal domain-containing protein [Candidatus Regiella insecticola]|uniref:secretin N-terminal domain-containing protein n=1 Tax=Candidatus Regiella insecticola TaxID=138073 RepID=UPI0030DA9522
MTPLKHTFAKKIEPLLRQLNDNVGSGSVIHYEPLNILFISGPEEIVYLTI